MKLSRFFNFETVLSLLMLMVVALVFMLSLLNPSTSALAQPNCTARNADSGVVTLTGQAAATVNSTDQNNCTGRGVIVIVDLTTMTTATVTVTIQGKDVASGKYYTLLAGAAKTSTGTTQMTVYPDVTASANVAINSPLPRTWRINVVVANNSGTAAVTGTIGASVIQ